MLENLLEKVTDPEKLLCEVLGISLADMSIFDEALAIKMKHKFPNGFHLINEKILKSFIEGGEHLLCFACISLDRAFNPLSPGVKLQILLLCFHAFLTKVVGRSC